MKLALKKDALADLTGDELTAVVAGATPLCVDVSRFFVSLCGCFTEYCSIDVC